MNKLSKGLIWVCVCLLVIVFILITQIVVLKKNSKYDVANMNEINTTEFRYLFDQDDTYVVFIGRSDCSVCPSMATLLTNIQKENNFITQYLDITKVDRTSDTWLEIVKLLDKETSEYVTEDHTGDKETNTFGYFLDTYGFTPAVLIIKNGKLDDGFIGIAEESSFTNWIENKVK